MTKTVNTILGHEHCDVAFISCGCGSRVYHTDLQCYVDKIEYDPFSRVGLLLMTDSSCDFRGCVRLFQAIDPKVKQIQTRTGDGKGGYKQDTIYTRVSSADQPGLKKIGIRGTWDSVLP